MLSGPLIELRALCSSDMSTAAAITDALAKCWDTLTGANVGGMQGDKVVHDRLEDLIWDGRFVRFRIERHGGTVNGSTRATLQHWVVDVQSGTAAIERESWRQLYKTAKRLDVNPIAEEVANLICRGGDDERVARKPDGSTRIRIGKIIPDDGYAQTISGRRRRFRKALTQMLDARGWRLDGDVARMKEPSGL